ncbi:putative nucleoredoxin 1 [Forsythia ovata]|uniref:protein-disulfide reductase n=1 Tax=Forsythia ovata TaxID=205694 RepID=A0ABD1PWB1_9LAMI
MREEVNRHKTNEDDDFKNLDGESDEVVSGSSLLSLLGSKDRDFLLSPTGTQVKISDHEGKVIGILFSANWYPPCQEFTRLLANTYEQLKHSDPGFEIVFVSSDEDLDAFNNYRACMPWLAIPFSDLETKRALNRRFDIECIPCLIILQPNKKEGTTIRDGVDLIYRYGIQAYPFTEERLEELLEKERDKHKNQTLKDLLILPGKRFSLGAFHATK